MKLFNLVWLVLSLTITTNYGLKGQCAKGNIYITKFMATSGLGTYESPAQGTIDFEFCFKLDGFFEASTNWVHGIFMAFDDLQSGVTYFEGPTGTQNTQYGNRRWIYIDSIKARNFDLPGPGFYVDDNDGNPRTNYGDNGIGTPNAKFPDLDPFCFKAQYKCGSANLLRPVIRVTGDGTTGGWKNPSCPGDIFKATSGGPNGNGIIIVCGQVLPLELISFKVLQEDGHNILQWQGIADHNFSHYIVEKKSNSEIEFSPIQMLALQPGTSENSIHSFSFEDDQIIEGTTYYRLKMVDKDLTFSYSQVISVRTLETGSSLSLNLYPVPAFDFLNLDILGQTERSDHYVDIYSLNGKKLKSQVLRAVESKTSYKISIQDLPKGVYFVKITSNPNTAEENIFKFIKG
ncbi:MAG TPA: T9SS type A sorting domain-containing protein [Saprospiraceae bacterium]|nr:T9SS type A sorting domain-containing protein [Saprospiraceae bacterium]